MKRYIKSSTVAHLTYGLEVFLEDVAQMVGPFTYSAFSNKDWSEDDIRKIKNFKRRWDRAGEDEDEDKMIKIGEEIGSFLETVPSK